MDGCLFCKIIAGDMPATIVHEDEKVIAFEDISPQAPVHILIVPRKHIPGTNDLSPEDASLVGRIHLVAGELAAEKGIAENGYRIVCNCGPHAGQAVDHIHFHLLGGRPMAWPPG